jgi:molecular chaperone DnaK (HSP70)
VRLGIDFGTTRTVVSYADRGNYPVLSFQDPAGDARDWFPTLVAEREGELRFGLEAAAVVDDPTFTVLRSFKRLLSDPHAVPQQPVAVGSLTLTLGELLVRFLSALRDAIRERSNLPKSLRRDKEMVAVVAVPANALGAQRFVTLDAFWRAGFVVSALLNEPSAAGFEYTHRHSDTLTSKREHVVVYDLGGGTFDASLVRMSGAKHEAIATAGLARLGGDDFDRVLAELAVRRVGVELDALSPRVRAHLLEACRDAKERLNPSSRKIAIDLEEATEEKAKKREASIPVSEFYEACGPLVEQTIEAMAPVMARLDDELGNLAGIYVVGGASELPIVPRALRERYGRRVHRSPYPSAAVAIGLAIASDEEAGFALKDRYARTFGVFREGDAGREITFDPIFTRDAELPAAGERTLGIRRAYRAAHNVGHFRFFECSSVGDDGRPRGDLALFADVRFPFEAKLAKKKELSSVPIQRLPGDGPHIEEAYAIDEHGLVEVTIKNLDDGYQRTFRLGESA